MKKLFFIIAALLTVSVLFTSCSFEKNKEINDYIPEPEYDEKTHQVTWYADLIHSENIVTDNKIVIKTEEYIDEGLYHGILIYDENGELIYSDYIATWHTALNSYQLYKDKDGKNYIMQWKNDLYMGVLYIGYEIFSFDSYGNKTIFDKDELYHKFPPNENEWAEHEYPTDEINDFTAKINDYLEAGFILMSTLGFELKYSTPGNLLTEKYIIPVF